jgi:hypothetical protein
MTDDELELRIRSFVAHEIGVDVAQIARISPTADLVDALSIYGDQVFDLVENFGEEFEVDVSDFRWYHHSGPEGCNPLWILFKPWWHRKTHVSLRLADFIESARQKRWTIAYPENERAR